MEIVSLSSITTLSWLLIIILKETFSSSLILEKIIPLIVSIFGGILGLVSFFISKQVAGTDIIFHSIISGIMYGLSAMGVNNMVGNVKDLVLAKKLKKSNTILNNIKQIENLDMNTSKEILDTNKFENQSNLQNFSGEKVVNDVEELKDIMNDEKLSVPTNYNLDSENNQNNN